MLNCTCIQFIDRQFCSFFFLLPFIYLCFTYTFFWANIAHVFLSTVPMFHHLPLHSFPDFWLTHFSSVQFSHSVMSDSLRPHESQHTRPPCPSPTPGVHPNSCPSSQRCHPAISSSAFPFSSCPQSLPASESFPVSQLFAWGGQSTGVSALASFLPKKSQGWSPSEWLVGSPCSPRNSQESSPTPQFKSINSSVITFLHTSTFTSTHDHWKNHSLD